MSNSIENPQQMVEKFKGRALNLNVIVRQVINENITKGGLDITGVVDKNEKMKKGIVVSLGSECPKNDVKVGDTVLYDDYKVSPLTLDAVQYMIVHYGDLVHVL